MGGVDLDGATAVIGHQVTVVESRIVLKELPKTKCGHVIRLDSGTVAMLRAHRKTQNEKPYWSDPASSIRISWSADPTDRRTTPTDSASSSNTTGATSTEHTPRSPAATRTDRPRPPPHLGQARIAGGHRHQDRQRAPRPLVDPHHQGDLHPRDSADARRRCRTGCTSHYQLSR